MYWNGSFGKESVIRSPSSYYYAPQHIAATAAVAPRQVGSLVMCSIYLHKWSNQLIMSIWRYLIEGIGKTSWSTCYFTFRDLTVQSVSTNFQYRWTSLLVILFCGNRSLQLFDMKNCFSKTSSSYISSKIWYGTWHFRGTMIILENHLFVFHINSSITALLWSPINCNYNLPQFPTIVCVCWYLYSKTTQSWFSDVKPSSTWSLFQKLDILCMP